MLGIESGERILEVGTGSGIATLDLAQHIHPQTSLVGIDFIECILCERESKKERKKERERERERAKKKGKTEKT